MDITETTEKVLKIVNGSPYGRIDMDSSEAGEIWKILNAIKNHGVIGDVIFSCPFIEHKTQDSDICAKCGQHRLDHE